MSPINELIYQVGHLEVLVDNARSHSFCANRSSDSDLRRHQILGGESSHNDRRRSTSLRGRSPFKRATKSSSRSNCNRSSSSTSDSRWESIPHSAATPSSPMKMPAPSSHRDCSGATSASERSQSLSRWECSSPTKDVNPTLSLREFSKMSRSMPRLPLRNRDYPSGSSGGIDIASLGFGPSPSASPLSDNDTFSTRSSSSTSEMIGKVLEAISDFDLDQHEGIGVLSEA